MSNATEIDLRLATLEFLLAEPRRTDKIEELAILHRAEAARAAGWKFIATQKGDPTKIAAEIDTAGIALKSVVTSSFDDACDKFVAERLSDKSTRKDVRALVEEAKNLNLLARDVDIESRTRTIWRRHQNSLDNRDPKAAGVSRA
jgi:hypothetical protein